MKLPSQAATHTQTGTIPKVHVSSILTFVTSGKSGKSSNEHCLPLRAQTGQQRTPKLSCCIGTIDLATAASRCWRLWWKMVRSKGNWQRSNCQNVPNASLAHSPKKHWTKGTSNKTIKFMTPPSQGIFFNQLVRNQVSSVTHLKGQLAHKWYKTATIFVNHSLCLHYLHFHESPSLGETVQTKGCIRKIVACHCIRIK